MVCRYKISGAVDSYEDASELNFKIVGTRDEISNVTATVRFQDKSRPSRLGPKSMLTAI